MWTTNHNSLTVQNGYLLIYMKNNAVQQKIKSYVLTQCSKLSGQLQESTRIFFTINSKINFWSITYRLLVIGH